jgi:hypothetical protein
MNDKIQNFLIGKEKWTVQSLDDQGSVVNTKVCHNVPVRLNGNDIQMDGVGTVDINEVDITVGANDIRIKRKGFDNADAIIIS